MVSRISPVAMSASSAINSVQSLRPIANVQFGSDSAPADEASKDKTPKSWWSSYAKPMLRALFMYDLPSKEGINQLAEAYPDNKKAQTLKKHARWAENTLRVLNWANWAMIFTLPIPILHFVTGPVLLGTAVVEIGARIGLESYMHKRASKLYDELSKPAAATA